MPRKILVPIDLEHGERVNEVLVFVKSGYAIAKRKNPFIVISVEPSKARRPAAI